MPKAALINLILRKPFLGILSPLNEVQLILHGYLIDLLNALVTAEEIFVERWPQNDSTPLLHLLVLFGPLSDGQMFEILFFFFDNGRFESQLHVVCIVPQKCSFSNIFICKLLNRPHQTYSYFSVRL